MTKSIGNDNQTTAETWEIGVAAINMQAMPILYKDENGIYHTISAVAVGTEIINDVQEVTVLTGEIVDLTP